MTNYADRLDKLPAYIFADLERLQSDLTQKGVDIISLGIGDPDLPPPRIIIESLKNALTEPGSSNYSTSAGEGYFRSSVAEWYRKRFGVALDPNSEVCALIGSKEGLANIGRALLNPSDKALLPDPGYPVYAQGSTILSDAIPVVFNLTGETFQPDLSNVHVDDRTKLLFLNYPCNPTGAVAEEGMLETAVNFCTKHNLVFCYDNAYSEICFGSYRSPSVLQIHGAMECAVEFNSCSKMFNMTGYRVGFAVGNRKVIAGLKKVKAQTDSGLPRFIQRAAATALDNYFDFDLSTERKSNNEILKERLDILVQGLQAIEIEAKAPKATFYLWVNVGTDGATFVKELLKLGVVATPGTAFGANGTTYVRFSVTQSTNRIQEAVQRMRKLVLTKTNPH
jgi:LL-diaminopimelate aminotransferase